MGSKYTVEAWGKHFGDSEYSLLVMWAGQSFIKALFHTWKTKRAGFGCVTLSVR
jgi:hypothetical protein